MDSGVCQAIVHEVAQNWTRLKELSMDAGQMFTHYGTPSPLLIATGEAIHLRGLERVPGVPGAPQDEAGLTRIFET